jgi:hypothetical protein
VWCHERFLWEDGNEFVFKCRGYLSETRLIIQSNVSLKEENPLISEWIKINDSLMGNKFYKQSNELFLIKKIFFLVKNKRLRNKEKVRDKEQ